MPAALLTALLLVALPAADRSAAQGVVRLIEERHAGTGDLTARFVQVYRSGLLGREAKTFVSDGRHFYFYVPADRQVVVRSQDDERSIPSLLLSGKGDILGQFA